MILKSNKGSMTIFQIILIAFLISIFALLSSYLIRTKTQNNLIRSEKLISESLLNMYDTRLYEGFSLLGYEEDEEKIYRIRSFYNNKYKVDIGVESSQLLSDENILRQMKTIVIARLGVSYLDDMTQKLEIKDDILSMISKARGISNSLEKKLEIYDEFLSLTSSISGLLLDIERGRDLFYIDENYNLSSLNYRLGRIIELDHMLGNYYGQEGNISNKYIFDKIEIHNGLIESSDNTMLIDILKRLKREIAYAKNKGSSSYDYEALLDIGESLSVRRDYELNNSNREKKSYWDMYRAFKDYYKDSLGEGLDDSYFISIYDYEDEAKSDLQISFVDKIAFIEYLTIMLRDQVKSDKRDHYYSIREESDFYKNMELEAVITGAQPEKARNKVRNFIKLIRFPSNLLHIYTSAEKKNSINSLSMAIAAIIPVPPIRSSALIATSWAYLETMVDLSDIYKGRGVSLVKVNSGDWRTDFGFFTEKAIGDDFNNSSDDDFDIKKKEDDSSSHDMETDKESFSLYYNDYLRLMGLSRSSSDMMYRFKLLISRYMEDESFNINELVIEHKIEIYLDKGRKVKFKETLIDGYIK